MNILKQLDVLGQSLWYDNIQRSQLIDGSLKSMIDRGIIRGVTSNPSIFQKSISSSSVYDETLKPMAWSGLDSESIFWQLAIEDIQKTADLFKDLYVTSGFVDGFVSLEVSPYFANDTQKTVDQAKELWQKVNRSNLMIKIPATKEGIPAIREVIACGINVNVTLIFSLERYKQVMSAYLAGLEDRIQGGKSIDQIASVASFFVSRVDTKIDGTLVDKHEAGILSRAEIEHLQGQAAIANARLAYGLYEKVVSSERFQKLASHGAKMQRPLWASTSTKNPNYRDVIYLEELIGSNTVNTVPPMTLTAFLDHGIAKDTIHKEIKNSNDLFDKLSKAGISIDKVTEELEIEGVQAFSDSFTNLLGSIENRRTAAIAELGVFEVVVSDQVRRLKETHFIDRFYAKDATLWTTDPAGIDEIHKRMNWVKAPIENRKLIPNLVEFRKKCLSLGYDRAVVLGMGGSSLAPEVFSLFFSNHEEMEESLSVSILDSTDPEQVLEIQNNSPLRTTLFIVASKSGSTGEINAFSDYFWDLTEKQFGKDAGKHFAAITDPGSPLEILARERDYLQIFSGDPQVGGRYSALTAFGLVPAALIGMDIERLLDNASRMAEFCNTTQTDEGNPGLVLGAYIGCGAISGRNKLTVLTDSDWKPFGNWLEQLIAESSGKIGKGITPVVNEPLQTVDRYGKDRLFVYLKSNGENSEFVSALRQTGQPVMTIEVSNPYDLGAQFYLWEVATPVACSILGVNVFDQPDVQDAKTRTLRSLAEFKKTGKLNEPESFDFVEGIRIAMFGKRTNKDCSSLPAIIKDFLGQNLNQGDYVGINAFLPMNSENEEILTRLRKNVLENHQVATMVGFGPRFLHSTGQLHKGGPDEGVFIVITGRRMQDLEIPGQGISFGTLQRAQAMGDMDALASRSRRMIWIDLPDVEASLSKLS